MHFPRVPLSTNFDYNIYKLVYNYSTLNKINVEQYKTDISEKNKNDLKYLQT